MRTLKRLTVWFLETLCQIWLLAVFLFLLVGPRRLTFRDGVEFYVYGITLLSLTTGYLLTTLIFRVLWRGRTFWSYALVAAILYSFHFEIYAIGVKWWRSGQSTLPFRAGAFIVFTCALAGSYVLRKWTQGSGKEGVGLSVSSRA
jgi:hypothetical protein